MCRLIRISLLFLVFTITLVDCETNEVLNEKIVIVGGGASGIAAASKLLQYGYENIVILEVENRIGGRIWTKCESDNCLDMGAKWIMGENGNVAYEMARDSNAVGSKLEENDALFVKSNGERIDKEKMLSLWKLFDETLPTYENRSETISDLFKNQIEQIDSGDLAGNLDKDTVKHFFKLLVESVTPVTDWNLETGKGLNTFKTIKGSTAISLNTGMNALLQILTGSFPNKELSAKWKNIIHLESKVKHISWNQPKPLVQYSSVLHPNQIRTIEAEHVIVTVPLGVLKEEYENLFVHPLPERKVNAIKNMSFGSVNQVFLTFEKQWWPNNTNFFVIWNDDDIQKLEDSDKWLSNMVGIFPEVNYPKTLAVWFVEKVNSTSETPSFIDVRAKLTNFIKTTFANQGWKITNPIMSQRTNWELNPNFRGSYSFRGFNASEVTSADLRESLRNDNGKQTVLFAGEATHNKYYSTVHGAIESGFSSADEIIKMHKHL